MTKLVIEIDLNLSPDDAALAGAVARDALATWLAAKTLTFGPAAGFSRSPTLPVLGAPAGPPTTQEKHHA